MKRAQKGVVPYTPEQVAKGVPGRAKRWLLKEKLYVQACDMWLSGMPLKDIAKELGYCQETVRAWKMKQNWDAKRREMAEKIEKKAMESTATFLERRYQELEESAQLVRKDMAEAPIKSREGALTSLVNTTREQRELRGVGDRGMTINIVFPNIERPTQEAIQSHIQVALPNAQPMLNGNVSEP